MVKIGGQIWSKLVVKYGQNWWLNMVKIGSQIWSKLVAKYGQNWWSNIVKIGGQNCPRIGQNCPREKWLNYLSSSTVYPAQQ